MEGGCHASRLLFLGPSVFDLDLHLGARLVAVVVDLLDFLAFGTDVLDVDINILAELLLLFDGGLLEAVVVAQLDAGELVVLGRLGLLLLLLLNIVEHTLVGTVLAFANRLTREPRVETLAVFLLAVGLLAVAPFSVLAFALLGGGKIDLAISNLRIARRPA